MSNLRAIALAILMALSAAGAAAEELSFVSAEEPAPVVSETEKVFEQTFTKDFNDIITEAGGEAAIFSLQDADILSWEESGQGKYIYFTLTPAKNEEIAKLTQENLGKALRININDNFVHIPEVTEALHQASGFVLLIDDEKQRAEFMRSMLDKTKKAPNTTVINLAPAIINVPEVPAPAPAAEPAPQDASGPADGAP